MLEGYLTVAKEAAVEQVIEKSRFIAIVDHVSNSKEIDRQMQDVQSKYPNARHYVYAYRLNDGRLEKASDDGEPQGTGGRPVLDLLQHRGVWNVQIIVVRYFGGVLLGTGGLTRAYGGTARLALEEAGVTRLVPNIKYGLDIPYSWYEQIKYGLKNKGWKSENEQFYEKITADIHIPEAEANEFESWIDELTSRQVIWKRGEAVLKPEKS